MLELTQFTATLACSLFAGAALYINVAEHPARMACDMQTAATIWAPSYRRATLMQAPLALLSFVSGLLAWMLGGQLMWLIAALLIGSVVPFTFIVIMPTNVRLLSSGHKLAEKEIKVLLDRWGKLHAVRSVLSLGAAFIFLFLLTFT